MCNNVEIWKYLCTYTPIKNVGAIEYLNWNFQFGEFLNNFTTSESVFLTLTILRTLSSDLEPSTPSRISRGCVIELDLKFLTPLISRDFPEKFFKLQLWEVTWFTFKKWCGFVVVFFIWKVSSKVNKIFIILFTTCTITLKNYYYPKRLKSIRSEYIPLNSKWDV